MTGEKQGRYKVVALAQARMGSSRLPNKMMLHLHGYPIIEWIFRRVSRASGIDALVFSISTTPADDVLALHLDRIGATVFRGSEQDVVDRFYNAATEHKATHVVRICCDNPLISPQQIDHLVSFYFHGNCDYAYNHIPRDNCYVDGLGAEMVSFDLLKTINQEAKLSSQREHVFNFIWENRDRFAISTFDPADPRLARPEVRLDIDTWQDYFKMSQLNIFPDMSDAEIIELFGEKQ